MIAATSPLVVSHPRPTSAGLDQSEKWLDAVTFEAFLPTAEKNMGLWEGVYERASIPDDLLARVNALDENWRLLVLSADWCGDASNIVPIFQRLVEGSPNLELRLLDRDENLDLMDEHLTGGTARAIPTVIILDGQNIERAWWGPRPAELQAWVKTDGQDYERDERYQELRKWYARDKGHSPLEELVTLLEGVDNERAA